MSEVTGPLPAITGPAALIAISGQVLAEIRKAQDLIRRDIAARGPVTELIVITARLAELEDSYRRGVMWAATDPVLDAPPLAAVPEQGRHRKRRDRTPRPPGERGLMPYIVKGLAPVAAAFAVLKPALPHMKRAASIHRILAAHKILTPVASVAVAGTTAAVLTVSGYGPIANLPWTSGTSPSSSVPGWNTSATPVPSSSLAGSVMHAKEAAATREKRLLTGSGVPVYLPVPSSSASSASSSASSSGSSSSPGIPAPTDPAVVTVSASTLDLSSGQPATITLTASGAPWQQVSWDVGTTGPDLDFSAMHGELRGGESYTLTVSVDPAQALDGDAQQVFTVNGQQVAVGLR